MNNPLKELLESKRFKNLPPYKQMQQYLKLKSKLCRRVEYKTLTQTNNK